MAADALDVVLNQAIVCAYAIPGFGAEVAGGLSILQAILDGTRPEDTTPGEYSLSQAIADLGQKIHDELAVHTTEDELVTIAGWQDTVTQTVAATVNLATFDAAVAAAGAQNFHDDGQYNKMFEALGSATALTPEEQVQALGTHFMARTAYHSLCQAHLMSLARAAGSRDPDDAWIQVHHDIRNLYESSLAHALEYARPHVAALDDASQNARERASATAATTWPTRTGQEYNAAFTAELRRIRYDAHLVYSTGDRVSDRELADYRGFIQAFDQTLAGLKVNALPVTAQPGAPGPGGGPVLGPRPPGVVRFLYETTPTGDWVNVVADSTVSPGGLATQNAGSNLPRLYYQFGGDPINGEFKTQLIAAAQLTQASAELAKAYDARYGPGAFAADSAGSPPRTDRLTSLLVPLSPGAGPVGDSVYAVIYSVGPQLGAAGIVDEAAYQQIYADAFAAIADWNSSHTWIQNFRVVLLSTGAFAGGTSGPALVALRAKAAGLVIDAAVAAVNAFPQLATLTVLVNTKDNAGGAERNAFDTAALTRKITPTNQGFDVPLS